MGHVGDEDGQSGRKLIPGPRRDETGVVKVEGAEWVRQELETVGRGGP